MKPKQFFYVLTGLMITIMLIGGAGYYLLSGQVREENKNLQVALADIQVAQEESNHLLKLKRQYEEEIKPLLADINALLPTAKQQSDFTAQLENLAGSTGVAIAKLDFTEDSPLPQPTSQTKKEGNTLAIPFTVDVQGSYDQVHNFLQGIEHFTRITSVEQLAGTKTNEGIKFSIQGNVYMKP